MKNNLFLFCSLDIILFSCAKYSIASVLFVVKNHFNSMTLVMLCLGNWNMCRIPTLIYRFRLFCSIFSLTLSIYTLL